MKSHDIILGLVLLTFISCENSTITDQFPITPVSAQEKISYSTSIYQSFAMIVLNEIADKSFICVVLFSMKNSKFFTFIFAMLALTAMNILAITVGAYIPILVYKEWLDWIAILAFTGFGVMNIYQGITMESETLAHEIEENEINLEKEKEFNKPLLEGASKHNHVHDCHDHHDEEKGKFVNAGYLAFLTNMVLFECGDKTQIATIVIATVYNPIGVFIGTTCGFAVCVILAITCGKFLGEYITEKMTNIISGIIFLIFALQYLLIKLEVF